MFLADLLGWPGRFPVVAFAVPMSVGMTLLKMNVELELSGGVESKLRKPEDCCMSRGGVVGTGLLGRMSTWLLLALSLHWECVAAT